MNITAAVPGIVPLRVSRECVLDGMDLSKAAVCLIVFAMSGLLHAPTGKGP